MPETNARRRERYKADPEYRERVLARNRVWQARNYHKLRQYRQAHHRKREYGLLPEEYAALLERQGRLCAICRRDLRLVVDHDHQTGEVRGLLCHRCNTQLAGIEDELWADTAHAYLQGDG